MLHTGIHPSYTHNKLEFSSQSNTTKVKKNIQVNQENKVNDKNQKIITHVVVA